MNFEDMPKVDYRDYSPCQSIKDKPTRFSFKNITIKVPVVEVKKGGFFTGDYSHFTVETEIPGDKEKVKVLRKDADFYTLRRLLKANHPFMLVPPLPPVKKNLQTKMIQKRQKYFQRFLQAISRSEILKSYPFTVCFLTDADVKEWEKSIKRQEKIKFVKDIKEILTPNG